MLVLGFPLGDLVTALRHGVGPLTPPGEVRRSARVWRAAARTVWLRCHVPPAQLEVWSK